MATLIITVEGDYDDLRWLRDRLDGAVAEVIEDNRSRFDGDVESSTEWGET